jgi:hypothetical protein
MSPRFCYGLLLLLPAGLSGCADAEATAPIGQRRQAVEGGEVDETHTAVFRIATRTQGFNGLCSSSLIAPNLLLTARHCVAETSEESVDCESDVFGRTLSPAELLFSNDISPELESRWFSPQEVIVRDESAFCGNDIALVVLEENVPSALAKPMAPRLSPISLGEPYEAVGYGGSDSSTDDAEYGTRRLRSGLSVACVGRSCGAGVVVGEFGGDEGVCRGDSGGPAVDGAGRAMGALSRGDPQCLAPVYTSAPEFGDWLIEAAAHAADTGEYPLPSWAGGAAPEPLAEPSPAADAQASGSNKPQATRPEPLRAKGCAASAGHTSGSGLIVLLLAVVGLLRQRARQKAGDPAPQYCQNTGHIRTAGGVTAQPLAQQQGGYSRQPQTRRTASAASVGS